MKTRHLVWKGQTVELGLQTWVSKSMRCSWPAPLLEKTLVSKLCDHDGWLSELEFYLEGDKVPRYQPWSWDPFGTDAPWLPGQIYQ